MLGLRELTRPVRIIWVKLVCTLPSLSTYLSIHWGPKAVAFLYFSLYSTNAGIRGCTSMCFAMRILVSEESKSGKSA